MLKEIEITNVKGIEHKCFSLDILPNRPSILVAPNGFGKSSFATAFSSLKPKNIKLDKKNLFSNDETKSPAIRIKYINKNNTDEELKADNSCNTISKKIACFVINSRLIPKATGVIAGRASVGLSINPIILMETIPSKGFPGYDEYKDIYKKINSDLQEFNCTWKDIKVRKKDGKLVLNFPSATDISNGQRDILIFIAMLFSARLRLTKTINLLIIDEVFDYLDDANLVAAQYYISNLIDDYKSDGKIIYPLILTHLDPDLFKNYTFSNQKVYYLEKSVVSTNDGMLKLLRARQRKDVSKEIQKDISYYLLHYAPTSINRRTEFKNYGIPELWGENDNFENFINDEIQKYLRGDPYDPLAVCGALRVKIEKIAYSGLSTMELKNTFLEKRKTINKLNFAKDNGIIIPESYYLLGIIYNDGMHLRDGTDNVSKIVSKLNHLVIKNMIKRIWDIS